MLRRLVIAAGVAVLVASVVVAMTHRGASYTRDQVVRAFAQQDFTLVEKPGEGWTGYAPLPRGVGVFLYPTPHANFYVYVAGSNLRAEQFFEPLARFGTGGDPGVFDALQGNVVVSSDGSLTQTGLTRDERSRIRAALALLDQSA